MPTSETPASLHRHSDTCRQVVDADRVWRVHEGRPLNGESTLLFDAGHTIRRVWQFPTDWATRTDAELLEICHRPVQRLARGPIPAVSNPSRVDSGEADRNPSRVDSGEADLRIAADARPSVARPGLHERAGVNEQSFRNP